MAYNNSSDIANAIWDEPIGNHWYNGTSGNGYIVVEGTSTAGDNGTYTIVDENPEITISDWDKDKIYGDDAYGRWDKEIYYMPDENNIELSDIINKILNEFKMNKLGTSRMKFKKQVELMERCKEILEWKGMWSPKKLEKPRKLEKPKKTSYLEDELFEI